MSLLCLSNQTKFKITNLQSLIPVIIITKIPHMPKIGIHHRSSDIPTILFIKILIRWDITLQL